MRHPRQNQARSELWLFLPTLVPAAVTGLLIFKYCVNVPYWDEWHGVTLLEKFGQGTLSFHDLFVQQNEYRQFFPNLVFVAVGWLTRWDVRYLMALSFLMACLVSFNVYHLAKHTFGGNRSRRFWTYLAANLLIFSPIQHQNWLQGQQFIYFVPIACLTSCLIVTDSVGLRTETKFVICAILATVSSFSSANGLLCWVLVLPVLAWSSSRNELLRKRWLIVAWLAALALSVALYFYDYRSPADHPLLLTALAHPVVTVRYFVAILGRSLALGRLVFAITTGSILIILFAWSSLRFLRSWKVDLVESRRVICWLMIGAYSLLTAALITIGRAGFGLEQALTGTRYATYTIYLAVALVYLVPITVLSFTKEAWLFNTKVSHTLLLRLMCAALIIIHIPMYLIGIRQMSSFRVALLQSKACALLVNVIQDDCITQKVYPDVQVFTQQINKADRLGFLRPSLVKSNRVQDIEIRGVDVSPNYGSFQSLIHLAGNKYVASGWAFLPHRGEPADAVLLAYDRGGDQAIIFAIADLNKERDFVSALLQKGVYGDSSWSETFSGSQLGQNRTNVTAWAFDALSGKAYKLQGSQVIGNSATSERP